RRAPSGAPLPPVREPDDSADEIFVRAKYEHVHPGARERRVERFLAPSCRLREALTKTLVARVHAKLLTGFAVGEDDRADVRQLVLTRVGQTNGEGLVTARDPLEPVHGPGIDRRREVEEKMRVDLAVLEILTHVWRIEPRRHVPVDMTDVVAEGVLADVREVQALAFEDRAVVALKEAVEPAHDGPLKTLEPALRRGGRHVPAAAPSARGYARAPA